MLVNIFRKDCQFYEHFERRSVKKSGNRVGIGIFCNTSIHLQEVGFDTSGNEPSKVCCTGFFSPHIHNAWIPYYNPATCMPQVFHPRRHQHIGSYSSRAESDPSKHFRKSSFQWRRGGPLSMVSALVGAA